MRSAREDPTKGTGGIPTGGQMVPILQQGFHSSALPLWREWERGDRLCLFVHPREHRLQSRLDA